MNFVPKDVAKATIKRLIEESKELSRQRTLKFRKEYLEAKKNGTEKAFFEELKKQNRF